MSDVIEKIGLDFKYFDKRTKTGYKNGYLRTKGE